MAHSAPNAMATTFKSFTAELILIDDPLKQERLMSAPEKIYLQTDDEGESMDAIDFTWCSDQINETDTTYIRADLHEALEADNKEQDRLLLAAALKYTGLEQRVGRLQTYAMLLEGKVSLDLLDWLLKTRRLLELEQEMANWLIPDEHREALAAEDDLSELPTQQKLTEEDMERN